METRADAEKRLARLKTELAKEQADFANLRLQLQLSIESHIASCYRELRRLSEDSVTALTGEADAQPMLDAEEELDACRTIIAGIESDIEELTGELEDDELWADAEAERYQLEGEAAAHIPGAWG